MLPLARLGISPIVAVLLLLPAAASSEPPINAAALTAIVVPLEPVGASGVGGLATIAPGLGEPGQTLLTLEVEGLQPGATYPAHVHAGSPAQPGAGFGLLGTLAADDAGRGRLQTATMAAAAAGVPVDLSLELLADGEHFIELHAPGMAAVAVGVIPPAAPNALPAAGPTGIDGVDAAIGAVLAGDADRLAGLARLIELPCGPETPEGFALVPPCERGEAPGTPVAVFAAAACEPYWARDPRPVLRSFVQHAGPLYAVVRAPDALPAGSLLPAGEYLVIFEPRPGSPAFGLALYLEDSAVVAAEAGCRGPRDLMQIGGEELPVIWGPSDTRGR